MFSQLELSVLRYRLGLATSLELRQVAKTAIDFGIYSSSLVEAAFDAEERFVEIGSALVKALQELGLTTFPESEDDCRWLLLRYHISQIAKGEEQNEFTAIEEMMDFCNLYDREDDVYDLYSIYDAVHIESLNYPQNLMLNSDDWRFGVVESCKAWLRRHPA
jgi:hypothetical protein